MSFESCRRVFRELHETGCFVVPNPWDAGTAKYLASLGFQALATTSAGFAFSRGLPDGAATLAETLSNISEIVQATELPVNADFGNGFAGNLDGIAENVRACLATGVAGLSIEDATGDPSKPLFELPEALERVAAARSAVDKSGSRALLTARAECYLVRHPDPFRESLRRLRGYADAGADVLYAPGVSAPEEMRAIVDAVAPKPVNVLISSDLGLRVSDLAEIGVRRISVGSSLARAAWGGLLRAAREIAEHGSFHSFRDLAPFDELNRFFGEDS